MQEIPFQKQPAVWVLGKFFWFKRFNGKQEGMLLKVSKN